jgi:hypothetical protein
LRFCLCGQSFPSTPGPSVGKAGNPKKQAPHFPQQAREEKEKERKKVNGP